MHTEEHSENIPLLTPTPYQYIGRDGQRRSEREPVLGEHCMEICIDGQAAARLVCIPQFLTELAYGFLRTEGYIRSQADVAQLTVCEQGRRADVLLKEKSKGPREISPVAPIPWETDHIFSLADRFAAGMPLHRETFATHSCFLARGAELLFSCEDIGRHNALDKAVGYALRRDIDLGACTLYSSGRIPTDMALKAIRAGVPVLASKASPSREAVALAKKYNLTLICAARKDRMKLFTGTAPSDKGENNG